MKNYCAAISTEIKMYADRDQQGYTNCCRESSNLKNMWKLKMMNTRSGTDGQFETSVNLASGANSHYWTDTNGLNIHIGSCDTDVTGYSKEGVSNFISTILMREFPDMEPSNARFFGYDLADEISMSEHLGIRNNNVRRIRIEWLSMALVFLYNETGPNGTTPILIDDQYHNIRKKR